jgi:hypothetical protein
MRNRAENRDEVDWLLFMPSIIARKGEIAVALQILNGLGGLKSFGG